MNRGSILVYTLLMLAVVAIFAISIVVSSSNITVQSARHLDTVQKRKEGKLYANNLLQIGASWYVNESPSFSSCDATALSLLAEFMKDVQDDPIDGALWLNVAQDASKSGQCVDLTDQATALIDQTATDVLPKDRELQVYAFKLTEDYGGRVLVIAKVGETFSWALGVRSGGGAVSPFFSSLVHSESRLDLYAANNVHFDGPVEAVGGLNLKNVHGNVTFDDVVRADGDVTITKGKNLTFYGNLEVKGDLLVTNKSKNIDFEGEVAVEDLLRVEGKSKNITFHSTVTLTQDPYISPDSEVDFDQGYQIKSGLSVDPVATILQSFSVDEYFSSLEGQAMELSDLWKNPPSEPVGIRVSGLAVVGFEYEEPMQRIGILDFDNNLSYYELMYNPSSGPPYHSDLRKYSFPGYEDKSFEFTGLILGNELLTLDIFDFIWSNNWMTLKGPLTLAAHDDIWIMQDVKYDFLPNNTNLWKSTAEMSTDTTLLTMVSKGNVNVMTRRIAGSFTSFLGKVNIWYKSNATIFGNIVERYSQRIDHNNLALIFDPRLAEGSVTYVEHPGEYIDGGSTGGIDLR